MRDITKIFDGLIAVNGISLEVRQGECFTLLGPSGCGKTTVLRIIAGLEEPDRGEIYLEGEPLAVASRGIWVPPEKRRMGLVPQSYAIWPHLSVFENVAYGLRVRRVGHEAIGKQVSEALQLVGLSGFEDRRATALSGGQQQRVALARALVYRPSLVLLDEPLSNLDAKLRDQMREELRVLQRSTGITVLFVTHDQVEAMSLSDRIAVMNSGNVEQLGNPEEVYDQPLTAFVRDFLGDNLLLQGRVAGREADGNFRIQIGSTGEGGQYILAGESGARLKEPALGQEVSVSVRPEKVKLSRGTAPAGENSVSGVVDGLLFIGDRYECRVKVGADKLLVYLSRDIRVEPGEKVFLSMPKEGLTVWPR
ncbi:MAG: ABC transporter ATP-binding protein [Deltaproteobacteria bacterium]|nr:ABC transporter ATP-binding protein [Deltaproteobacteria bacterium]